MEGMEGSQIAMQHQLAKARRQLGDRGGPLGVPSFPVSISKARDSPLVIDVSVDEPVLFIALSDLPT